MGGVTVKNKTKFKKTLKYFSKAKKISENINFEMYGEKGVKLLRDATPSDSGETSESWHYTVIKDKTSVRMVFSNDKTVGDNFVPLAILLQYGHAAKNGVWIEGVDYINPALKPLFEEIANEIWKEVDKP